MLTHVRMLIYAHFRSTTPPQLPALSVCPGDLFASALFLILGSLGDTLLYVIFAALMLVNLLVFRRITGSYVYTEVYSPLTLLA